MSDGWVFVCFIVGLILAGALFVFLLFAGPAKLVNEASCNQKGAQLQLPADYRLLSDKCYVQVPGGRWVPAEDYRVFQKGQR